MNRRNAIATTVRNVLSVCILFFCVGSVAFAQAGRGSISGLVTDPTGAVVRGAAVTALNSATGVALHAVTSEAGLYTLLSLNPGTYVVTASQKGFASVAQNNVLVTVDQVTAVNIALRVGNVAETVTVTGTSTLVDTSNSTVGQLIDAGTIHRVPLLTRNVYDLIQLSAGVTPANGSPNSGDSNALENISSGRPGIDVSSSTINGSNVGSVYFMIDGSPIGIAENHQAAIMPAMRVAMDGTEEMRMETQNTPASFQSGGAGVISVVTKSGTNKFHGDVFGVFRPDALSANEYFNKNNQLSQGLPNKPTGYHRYQEGGAIGGPIVRNKLFFFGDYEDTQEGLYDTLNRYNVPTSAERTGDFSAMDFTIYDPTQPDVNDMRQPFPGNKITNPNPIALKFMSEMPKCNQGASCDSATEDVFNNFFLPGLDPYKEHRFDTRVDWNESDKQRIFTRFSYDWSLRGTFNAFGSMWDPNYAQNVTNARNILVADDLALNGTTVLNLRYSFTRNHIIQGGDPAQIGTDITKLGFPAALAAQQTYKLLPLVTFNDMGSMVGGGSTAAGNVFVYASENSDANATLTKVWGKHEISTGFEYMKRYMNVGQPSAPGGYYAFDITATDQSTVAPVPVGGSDYASFLTGLGDGGDMSKDLFAAESNPYYAAFIEDTYHPTKSLTITAGLRWDIFGGRNERHNRLEYFDPNASNTVNGVSYTGAEVYNNGGTRSPFTTNMKDFGPRLGFAWQPITHLVVRGGGGFYFGPTPSMVAGAFTDSDGYNNGTGWNSNCPNADGNTVFYGTSACVTAVPGSPPLVPGNYTGPYSVSNPFPNGLIPLINSPTGLANNLGLGLSTVLRSQRTPTTYNFNFVVEYELPHQFVLSVGYVGSRGLFLTTGLDLDTLDIGTIQKYGASLCENPSAAGCQMVPNTWESILPPTNQFYGHATVPLWMSIEKYPQFAGVGINNYGGGDSEYSSLQTKLQKRLTSHFTALTTFTWAKLMTDDALPTLWFVGVHGAGPQDQRNLEYEHAVSPQDVKYQFTGQTSYDLPVGKGRLVNLNGLANSAFGGWTVDAVGYLSSGIPVASPGSGNPQEYYFNQRANLTCNPATGAPHTPDRWFNYNCFSVPSSVFTPGNAPAELDSVRQMGARQLDLTLAKTFFLGETKSFRFSASSYNITNTPQFGTPAVYNPTQIQTSQQYVDGFGKITNTSNSPRQFQFEARFAF